MESQHGDVTGHPPALDVPRLTPPWHMCLSSLPRPSLPLPFCCQPGREQSWDMARSLWPRFQPCPMRWGPCPRAGDRGTLTSGHAEWGEPLSRQHWVSDPSHVWCSRIRPQDGCSAVLLPHTSACTSPAGGAAPGVGVCSALEEWRCPQGGGCMPPPSPSLPQFPQVSCLAWGMLGAGMGTKRGVGRGRGADPLHPPTAAWLHPAQLLARDTLGRSDPGGPRT